jgi:hypothetical protein
MSSAYDTPPTARDVQRAVKTAPPPVHRELDERALHLVVGGSTDPDDPPPGKPHSGT